MALLYANELESCKECRSREFKIEERCTLVKTTDKYSTIYKADKHKAIVCCNCGKVLDTIKTHDNKTII